MSNIFQKIWVWLKRVIIAFFATSILSVIFFRFVPPPVTPLMIIRYIGHDSKTGERRCDYKWVPIDQISPNMVLAAVAAEDNYFLTHHGIDWDAVQKAREINKYSKIKHGASTITQQTAKNLFLLPSRTYIRKGFEVYFTWLLEIFWPKKRIIEVYLNIIELGDGIYGVESASQRYFHKPAAHITRNEAALITSVLPAPLKRNLARPNQYMYYYQNRVIILMENIGKIVL